MCEGLVTIVIPVYNVEKYLDRCMESVVNQTYHDIEIIMVDDGSPGTCPQKCEEWAERDHRIKVIHKKNAGLGMARNTGIENASGEYICFFDSDDYIALDTIEKSISLANRDNSDLVLFGMSSVSEEGKVVNEYPPYTEKSFYEGKEILDFVLPNVIEGSSKKGKNYNLLMSAWSCMFSMKMIAEHNWQFVSERQYISEDYYSLLHLYRHVQRVSVLKQACYYYCYNDSSLTHVYRPDRYERICHCYGSMVEVCDILHYSEKIKRCLASQFFGNAIAAMKLIVSASDHSFRDKRKILKTMMESEILHSALAQIDLGAETRGRKALIYAIKSHSAVLVFLQIKAKLLLSGR